VALDHFATVESISKRAVAIHNAGGFGNRRQESKSRRQDNREVFGLEPNGSDIFSTD